MALDGEVAAALDELARRIRVLAGTEAGKKIDALNARIATLERRLGLVEQASTVAGLAASLS